MPTERLVAMPPSPPKKVVNIKALAATISAIPSEIIAKGVPARRVVTKPNSSPNTSPATPPIRGTRVTGNHIFPAPMKFSACAQKNAPSPKYTAWPKDSNPVCPSNML